MKRFTQSSSSPTPSLNLTTATFDEAQENTIASIRSACPPDLRRDTLSAMVAQEALEMYQCCDYMVSYDQTEDDDEGIGNHLNETCRTSICEWMYRVVDHFGVDREVVTIALSYVDRVLSICLCPDRRTFKLISSTSLHLAIKIHSPFVWKEIGPLLPDLSRGDFDHERIVAMEKEMTHWLNWYLNQSTPQSMAVYLLSLLPDDIPSSILQNVSDMAFFLIELSVCDYYFVTERNSLVAIAAILNSTEKVGFDLCDFQNDTFSYRNNFRKQIGDVISSIRYKVDRDKVASARERLWSLYRHSTECSQQSMMMLTPPIAPKRSLVQGISSPTSCVDAKRLRCRSDFAFQMISGVPSLDFSVSTDSQDPPDTSSISASTL